MRGKHKRRSGGARWAKTIWLVAPGCGSEESKLSLIVPAPALEGGVVLHREAIEDH